MAYAYECERTVLGRLDACPFFSTCYRNGSVRIFPMKNLAMVFGESLPIVFVQARAIDFVASSIGCVGCARNRRTGDY